MAMDSDRSIVLCNPVSGQSAAVPPPPVFPVSKIILSAPPTSPGWLAAVLGRTGTIALLQPAISGAWMTIGVDEGSQHGGFRDMAFWRGRLCALGHDGAVLAFRADLRTRAATGSLLRDAERRVGAMTEWRRRWYLVESEEKLLLVKTVYKMWRDSDEMEVRVLTSPEQRRWKLVAETPGHALFVGSVVSMMVSVATASHLRDSCVYFARRDVEIVLPHLICVYSLLDMEMTCMPIAGGHSADVEPVWINPFV